MQASSLPDEQTLVRLVVAKRQSTVARCSQDRTCLTAQCRSKGAHPTRSARGDSQAGLRNHLRALPGRFFAPSDSAAGPSLSRLAPRALRPESVRRGDDGNDEPKMGHNHAKWQDYALSHTTVSVGRSDRDYGPGRGRIHGHRSRCGHSHPSAHGCARDLLRAGRATWSFRSRRYYGA